MGWPKGVSRRLGPKPAYITARKTAVTNSILAVCALPSRKAILWAREQELRDFVASGDHIFGDRYNSGTKDRAERELAELNQRDETLRSGAALENSRRALSTEARRQWIAKKCPDLIFKRSRKQAISEIQDRLVAFGRPVSSSSRLYADIAAIRKGWRVKY